VAMNRERGSYFVQMKLSRVRAETRVIPQRLPAKGAPRTRIMSEASPTAASLPARPVHCSRSPDNCRISEFVGLVILFARLERRRDL